MIGFDGLYFEKRATRGKYADPPYQRIYPIRANKTVARAKTLSPFTMNDFAFAYA